MKQADARAGQHGQHGQMIVMFAIALTAIVLFVGLAVDGGNALMQRRASQNAADFGALAGARVVAFFISSDTVSGTDANVVSAITSAVESNDGAVTFGAPDGPVYFRADGTIADYVGNGVIPTGAVGVKVQSSREWNPYFLGIIGMNDWNASAEATAKGGWAAGGPSGDVFPVGIASTFFTTYPMCSGEINLVNPSDPCYPKHLTPGNLNVPGGFGWLAFGAAGKCSGYGLGMINDGCDTSKPFLQGEIGNPYPGNSYGCCTAVSGNDATDRIGSLEGNKVSASCDYYIDNELVVTVPVWDYAGGNGNASGFYHIIGFTGFQLTACTGGKDIEGVWRRPVFQGPTTSTPGFAGAPLAVQLIR